MRKDYERLKICFIELSRADILTMSCGNDNDGDDLTDWGAWEE
jgi:hypothetical protein